MKEEKAIIYNLIAENRLDEANLQLFKLLNDRQKVQYAISSAKSVLYLFEKEFSGDDRPKKAIEAAEMVFDNRDSKTFLIAVKIAAKDSAEIAAEIAEVSIGASGAAGAASWAAETATRFAEGLPHTSKAIVITAEDAVKTTEDAAWSAAEDTIKDIEDAAWSAESLPHTSESIYEAAESAVRVALWIAERDIAIKILEKGIQILNS